MYAFLYLVKLGKLSDQLLGNSCSLPYDMISQYNYTPGIYADGLYSFVFPFVRSSVRSFVRSLVISFVTYNLRQRFG